MKRVKILSAEQAAELVRDGDTIATGGFVSCACPEALSKALEKRFLETGHPRDLTLFFAAGQGHRDGTGGDHYGHDCTPGQHPGQEGNGQKHRRYYQRG